MDKNCIWGKIQWRKGLKSLGKIHRKTKSLFWKNIKEKKAFEATYNGEKSRGFGKIHTKKMHSGQNAMAKNYILGKMQRRKRRGFGKTHTNKNAFGQNTIEKNCIWGKIQWRKGLKSLGKIHRKTKSLFWKNIGEKKTFEATYNGEKSRGFGKIHTKKMHSGQNTMAKNYILGKMQQRKRRGFGKTHTKKMHSWQNTMDKNCIWGKIRWRKGEKSLGKIHRKIKSLFWNNIREKKAFEATYNGEKSRGFGKMHTKKNAFWAKYNGQKLQLGQNAMEKA